MSKHIIIGTGPLGLNVMDLLVEKGEEVTLVNRSGVVHGTLPAGQKVAKVDVTNGDKVREICKGADVVYLCAMPAYTDWVEGLPPIISGVINGLSGTNTTLVFGDNLYMYGSTNGEPIHEDLPYLAKSRKGITRGKIAQMLLDAGNQGKLNVKLLRGSDFFGPRVSNSSLGDVLFKAALAGKTINVFGNPDLLHSATYIVDFARAMILAGANPQIKQSVFHVPNTEDVTMRKFVELVGREVGRPLKLRASGSSMVGFLGLFSPIIKEIREMMYQWEEPFVVDHSLFSEAFDFSATGHKESIRDTVIWFKEESKLLAS